MALICEPGERIYLLGESLSDRQAYGALLRSELGLEPAVDSNFAPVSIWNAMRGRPSLAIAAVDRPTVEVRDAVHMIPRLRGETRVLVLGAAVDPSTLALWGPCPICGYVVKDGGIDELRLALAEVCAGRDYYSTGVRDAIRAGREHRNGRARLTRRELELLPLLARGLTLREAANRMTVSYKTADTYRTNLLRKLGLRDRVELARYAIREKIVEA